MHIVLLTHLKAAEFLDLVLYERSEGRHHDRHSAAHERGELVAEALSPSGGHEDETVVVEERGIHRL